MRSQLVTARRSLTEADRAAAADALCATALTVPEVTDAGLICCYVAIGPEPPTDPLLAALRDRGARILLPVLLADGDLDWAEYHGPEALVAGLRGTRSPATARLGVAAVGNADVVLAPGVAVDRLGVRLGRGAGSYDRALSRVRSDAFTAVLLYDHEIVDALPHEAHDQRVAAAITPRRVVRF